MATKKEQLDALALKQSRLTATRARAQVEHDAAIAARDAAVARLREYGVSTSAEAGDLLKALEAELDEEIQKISSALEAAGA